MRIWNIRISNDQLKEERLKGAHLSVYFRWAFVILLTILLIIQSSVGYKNETSYGFMLVSVYFASNLALWYAAIKKYNPRFLGFAGALIDIGVICTHIFILSTNFDPLAVSSAATMFLIPVIFLLYTFRLDIGLLIFLIVLAILGFSFVYFYNYINNPDIYSRYLSLTPTSHFFKIAYIAFIGILCLYLQYFMTQFIEKQLAGAKAKADLDLKIKVEEEKSRYAKQLIEQERKLNKRLEKEVNERTRELTEANTRLIELQKTNLQSQFEVLKQQVNPHFLFNSLNVLSSLIKVEPDLAEQFTEKLSKVYRYVLENKEKDIVPLSTELEFLNSFVFLLNIRFMGKLSLEINIDKVKSELMILPMALQLLIENAIKHNTFSKEKPLNISISVDNNDYLVVTNNTSIRKTQIPSTGVGLTNIKNRYSLISDREPTFQKTDKEYIARIPLIRAD